jgi:hypothetical protein
MGRTLLLAFCLVLLLPAGTHGAATRGALAYLAAVTGGVDLYLGSAKAAQRGSMGRALAKGDRVQVGKDGAATLLFNDGSIVELKANSSLTVGAGKSGAAAGKSDQVLASVFQSVSDGVVGGSRETGLVALAPVRSSSTSLALILSPRQTDILETKPGFRWRSIRGATRYRVVVSGENGELWQRETADTTLGYPGDAAPLARGAELLWEVHASNDKGPVHRDEATFRVKPEAEAEAVIQRLTRIEEVAGPSGQDAPRFIAGAYLAGEGLLDDAIERFEALCRQNPSSPEPHEALGRLYRSVGLMDLATAELQTALTLTRER